METTGGGTRNVSAHVEKVPEQNALHSLAKGWDGGGLMVHLALARPLAAGKPKERSLGRFGEETED